MKLFFTKDDTLYKIMRSIEKLPKGKEVSLYIDYQNSFYSHPWWGKQIVSLMQERDLHYSFICKHPKAKKYFDEHGITYEYEAPNRFLQTIHLFWMLMFNAKKFHLSVFTKKSTLSYIFVVWEIIWIWAIIYVMYQFLVPSATLLVQPAYTVEDVVYNFRYYPSGSTWYTQNQWSETNYITIPFQIWSIKHTQSISVPLQSVQFLSNPSKWLLEVVNTLPIKFTLKQYTRFKTSDWLQFTADEAFILPPGSRKNPSRTSIQATSIDKDESWNIAWEKWNITLGTRLVIKNLSQSAILWAVYASVTKDFAWWITRKWWLVTDEDIDLVKQKLINSVTWDNKKLIVKKEFNDPNGFLLPLTNFITMTWIEFTFNGTSWSSIDTIDWTITVIYRYPYVIRDSLMQWVSEYVWQRPSQTRQLISLQKNTATFYDTYTLQDYIILPTKVSAVRWYDFDKDQWRIKDDLKQKTAWLSLEEAKKIILAYPEISSVVIKASPVWADTLPTLKSRIYIKTTTPEQ
jgi:hypothetical protein